MTKSTKDTKPTNQSINTKTIGDQALAARAAERAANRQSPISKKLPVNKGKYWN